MLIREYLKEIKYKNFPLIVYGNNPFGASVKGAFKPFIFIDVNLWKKLDKNEKKVIIYHEISHIRSRDNLTKLILNITYKAFFYLPQIYLPIKSFEEIAEMASDGYSLIKTRAKEKIIKSLAKITLILDSQTSTSFFPTQFSKE
ncbi:MAG: M56 family metallopeptidase [Candidatus Hydrothermales bacterium]